MSLYPAAESAGRPLGPAARFGHAGGMKAISRRLSAATPPEPHANQNASQRDASTHREGRRTLGPLAGIPSGCDSFSAYPGGVAALNHRLTLLRGLASKNGYFRAL